MEHAPTIGLQLGDTHENQANRLLGVLGVSTDDCPADEELGVLLWHAIDAALKQKGALEQIREIIKEIDR